MADIRQTVTFDDIRRANEAIRPTSLAHKGKDGRITYKDYAEVPQRIKAFRMVYPQGFIRTEIISYENGVVVMKSEVGYYENGEAVVIGTGAAYEKEGSSFINTTSYIENCETSAVGRALGMAGFGVETSVASAEEVANAMKQQDAVARISVSSARRLQSMFSEISKSDQSYWVKLSDKYKISKVTDIKKSDYDEILEEAQNRINEIKGEGNGPQSA